MDEFARFFIVVLSAALMSGCGLKTEDAEKPIPSWLKGSSTVDVSWTKSIEAGVNKAGGGYRVYIGNKSGFSLSDAPTYDVVYDSVENETPLKTQITSLKSGKYYVRVAGFNSHAVGAPSAETTVVVP
jgi:hypothetical protein